MIGPSLLHPLVVLHAFVSFDTLGLGPLRLRVKRHIGIGLSVPSCQESHWRWAPCAVMSFDTLTMGSLGLRSFQHVGDGFSMPSCLVTHCRWAPCAFASFDMVVFSSPGLPVLCWAPCSLMSFDTSMVSPLAWCWACGINLGAAVSSSVLGRIHCRWVSQFCVGLCSLSSGCLPPHWPHFVIVVVTSSDMGRIPRHQVSQLCIEGHALLGM
jgi:hypothetical protein